MSRRARLTVFATFVALVACSPSSAFGAGAGPDPFFGTLFEDNANLTQQQRGLDMDRQAATGLGVIRVQVHWAQIEKSYAKADESPVFDWNALDQIVGDAAKRNLRILPVVYDTPVFYRPSSSPSGVQVPPEKPEMYGRFVGRLAQRYGPNGHFWRCDSSTGVCPQPYLPIKTWQVWNEPNYSAWWKNAPNPDGYLALLKQAYLNIKLADSSAEVVMAGLAPLTGTTRNHTDFRTYLNALYAAGAKPFFDTLAIHAYGTEVEDVADVPKVVRQIADANSDSDKKIWITEYGWATGGANSFTITNTDCQAARLHKVAVEWRRLRQVLKLRGAIQLQWRDVETTRLSWPFYAGLNSSAFDGPPKPALGELADAIAFRTPDPRYTVDRACVPGSPEDLALAQPVTASSTGPAASTEAGSEPKRAVDGLSNTRWSSAPGPRESIRVDLGSRRNVSRVRLDWASDYATHYLVKTSSDGSSFIPAGDVTIDRAGPHTSSFSPRSARYVRVTAIKRSSAGGGISLWDLNVFDSAPPPLKVASQSPPLRQPPLASLSRLSVSPHGLRAASRGASIAATKRKTGATVSYRDSQDARTTFMVLKSFKGFTRHGRCVVKRPVGHRRAKRCTLYKPVGSFSHADKAGMNTLRFTGRVRGRKLGPGAYRLRAVPRFAGRNGAARTTSFRALR